MTYAARNWRLGPGMTAPTGLRLNDCTTEAAAAAADGPIRYGHGSEIQVDPAIMMQKGQARGT